MNSVVSQTKSSGRSNVRLPGEPGVWVVIFGDLLLFGVFFFTFMYYRAGRMEQFSASHTQMNRDIGITNTLLLLTASLAVVAGVHAYRAGALRAADRSLRIAILAGLGFLVLKSVEYGQKISESLVPNTNEYFLLYYCFTGVHFFHVIVGVAILFYMKRLVDQPSNDPRTRLVVESGALFWHMVDLLWIVLFALFYMVG